MNYSDVLANARECIGKYCKACPVCNGVACKNQRSVVELEVTVDYSLYERAALLIQAAGAKLADPQFTDRVTLRWQMPEGTEPPLLEQLRELTRGAAQVSVSQPFYAPF